MEFKVGDLVKTRSGREFIVREIVESLDRYYLRDTIGVENGTCSTGCILIKSQSNYYFY